MPLAAGTTAIGLQLHHGVNSRPCSIRAKFRRLGAVWFGVPHLHDLFCRAPTSPQGGTPNVGLTWAVRLPSKGRRCTSPANLIMPTTPDDLFAYLNSLGITHRTVTHPPMFTVEQSRELRRSIPGGHTKNLFLKDKKGALVLVVTLDDAVIELRSL